MDAHTTPSAPVRTPLSDATCAICANDTVTLLLARQTLQTVVQWRQCDLRHVICTQALDNTSEEVVSAEPLSDVGVAAVELERVQQSNVNQVEEKNRFPLRLLLTKSNKEAVTVTELHHLADIQLRWYCW